MRATRWLLPLASLVLLACQTELYPEAPIPPSTSWVRASTDPSGSASASATPGLGWAPEPIWGGTVLSAGARWVESFTFLSQNNGNALVWGFLPLDELGQPPALGTLMQGTLKATLAGGTPVTKSLKVNAANEPPFLFLIPANSGFDPQKTYQLQLDFTVGGQSYTLQATSKSS